MASRDSLLRAVVVLGLAGGLLALAGRPASAGWRHRKVVVVESGYSVAVPTTVIAPAPVVVSAPIRAVYNVPTVVPSVVETVVTVPSTYSAVVPSVYVAPTVVRPVERVKVVYPRRVYRYSY